MLDFELWYAGSSAGYIQLNCATPQGQESTADGGCTPEGGCSAEDGCFPESQRHSWPASMVADLDGDENKACNTIGSTYKSIGLRTATMGGGHLNPASRVVWCNSGGYTTGYALVLPSRARKYTTLDNLGYLMAGPMFANEGKWTVSERVFPTFPFDSFYLDDATTGTRDLLAFFSKRSVCKANNNGMQDCYNTKLIKCFKTNADYTSKGYASEVDTSDLNSAMKMLKDGDYQTCEEALTSEQLKFVMHRIGEHAAIS